MQTLEECLHLLGAVGRRLDHVGRPLALELALQRLPRQRRPSYSYATLVRRLPIYSRHELLLLAWRDLDLVGGCPWVGSWVVTARQQTLLLL